MWSWVQGIPAIYGLAIGLCEVHSPIAKPAKICCTNNRLRQTMFFDSPMIQLDGCIFPTSPSA